MKLLVILCSHEFDITLCDNVRTLNDYMKNLDMEVDYCGISSKDDFHNYETIIPFKYKVINSNKQIEKLCDFITEYKSVFDYDYYMKIRPDIKLLEQINFDLLSKNAINARARVYRGPKKIQYGMSINGVGCWKYIGDCYYDDVEKEVILDDQIFIFHKNIVELGAFDKIEPIMGWQHEWAQTKIFNDRKIPLNVIGIYVNLTKYTAYSGNINM